MDPYVCHKTVGWKQVKNIEIYNVKYYKHFTTTVLYLIVTQKIRLQGKKSV